MIEQLWWPCEICDEEPSCSCGGCESHCTCDTYTLAPSNMEKGETWLEKIDSVYDH
jgi:hypothetical protein